MPTKNSQSWEQKHEQRTLIREEQEKGSSNYIDNSSNEENVESLERRERSLMLAQLLSFPISRQVCNGSSEILSFEQVGVEIKNTLF